EKFSDSDKNFLSIFKWINSFNKYRERIPPTKNDNPIERKIPINPKEVRTRIKTNRILITKLCKKYKSLLFKAFNAFPDKESIEYNKDDTTNKKMKILKLLKV